TLSGPDLEGFTAPGPADHVKLFVPDPETGELRAPRVGPAGIERPAVPPIVRDYTPRATRPGEVDVDVLLHEHSGPVSGWAAAAAPGASAVIGGPRGSKLFPDGAEHLLLGGDETALPALARWLEAAPDGIPVDVLVEVEDAAEEAYLDGIARPEHRVRWLHRQGSGSTPLLLDALRSLPARPGVGYAWFAGEATSLVPVRRWLRHESPFDRRNVAVDGYWKRGVVALDHHAPLDPDDTEGD
ncbi:siderophore-interacting protein, partial [Georgenia sp. 10Sc9-8]|nr:siderophore-interacting protein [Georgenia halotolerans]